ncbi:MAG: DUF3048 domain-containing protein [Candidatus Caldatribacteriota bacterium]|nr:DUF3048 domain-containing protein [Candidatus Caldatribacteriota bacterium]
MYIMYIENIYIKRYVKLAFILFIAFICFNICVVVYDADSISRPLAVMVGNSTEEITHQTGLQTADVIYEINVETPYTRLMAIFLTEDSNTIGPIRSSRYYFSRLAAEWSSIFAHCGGQILKDDRIVNLDQMRYSYPYWRDKKIGGWTNLFANTEKIREKSRKTGFQDKINLENNFLNFRAINLSGGNISKICIKYNQKYSVSYEYDIKSNTYLRYINSKLYKDYKTLKPLNVSNIIIQYVQIEKIPGDTEGRVKVGVIGEGIAKAFYGGRYFLVKWVKKSKDHPTLYYDNQGNLLKLNKGKVWIEIVSKDTNIWFK